MYAYLYDDNGKIIQEIVAPRPETLRRMTDGVENCFFCDEPVASMDSVYFSDGKVLPRPSMPLTVDGTTINGIPEGASLLLGDRSYVCEDGVAEIDGYHGIVKIVLWPYLDEEVEL
jgi:hypothetical protein